MQGEKKIAAKDFGNGFSFVYAVTFKPQGHILFENLKTKKYF